MLANTHSILMSLIKIIIRYHDIQSIPKIVTEPTQEALNDIAKKILSQNENIPSGNILLKETLQSYINESTKNYQERKPFLNFILYHIEYLKPIAESKLFNSDHIENIFKHLYQLIMDVKGLLRTSKGKSYEITQGDNKIKLKGLVRPGYLYIAGPLCDSGQIALEELLGGLDLKQDSSDEEIAAKLREIVDQMFLVSQVELFTAENQLLKNELDVKEYVIHDLERREESLKDKCTPVEHLIAQNQRLKKLLAEKEQLIHDLERREETHKDKYTPAEHLTAENQRLKKQLAEKEQVIHDLKRREETHKDKYTSLGVARRFGLFPPNYFYPQVMALTDNSKDEHQEEGFDSLHDI